jgi:hypothetical protein
MIVKNAYTLLLCIFLTCNLSAAELGYRKSVIVSAPTRNA